MSALRFALAVAVMLMGLAAGALGQNVPAHLDPGARDDVVEPVAVPALRFLTTPDFPPFNYTDANGRLVGFNIDIADAICARLNARCTIQAWPWDRAHDALAENQGDALIAGVDIDPQEAERFDFSRIYLQLPARFVTPRTAAEAFAPSRLEGVIATREGSTHAELVARTLPQAQVVGYADEFAALAAVEAGEANAYFGDAVRAAFWLNENPDCCAFAGEVYFRPDLFGAGLAVAVPAGLDNVRVAINWALMRLQREGRLDEIYLRWFPVSFY